MRTARMSSSMFACSIHPLRSVSPPTRTRPPGEAARSAAAARTVPLKTASLSRCLETQGKGSVLAMEAVGTQGKGSVLAMKAVETPGKGSVLAMEAVEAQDKGSALAMEAVET